MAAKIFVHNYEGKTVWLPTYQASPEQQANPSPVVALPSVLPEQLQASVYLLPFPVNPDAPDVDTVHRAVGGFRGEMTADPDFLTRRKFGSANPFGTAAPVPPPVPPVHHHHQHHQGHHMQHDQHHGHHHHQHHAQEYQHHGHHHHHHHHQQQQQHHQHYAQHQQQQQQHSPPPPVNGSPGPSAANPYNLPSYPLPPAPAGGALPPVAVGGAGAPGPAKQNYCGNAPPNQIPRDAIRECDPIDDEIKVVPDDETIESFIRGAKSKVYVATLPRTRRVAWLRDYAMTVSQNMRYVSLGGGLTVVMNADARDLTHSKPMRLVERQLCVYFMQHGFCGRPTCQNIHHSERQVKRLIAARHAELKLMTKDERQKVSDDLILEEIDEVEAEAAKEGLLAGPTRIHLRAVDRPKAAVQITAAAGGRGRGRDKTSSSDSSESDSDDSSSSGSDTDARRRSRKDKDRKKEKKRKSKKDDRRRRLESKYGKLAADDAGRSGALMKESKYERDRRGGGDDRRDDRNRDDRRSSRGDERRDDRRGDDRRRDEWRRDDHRDDDRRRHRDERDDDRSARRHRDERH